MVSIHHPDWKHEDRIVRNPDYNNLPAVKLFMYDIKNINNFYHRNHPYNLHPNSDKFEEYWSKFEERSVEGLWVKDEETWVYMMPKLFFYINYVVINDKAQKPNRFIKPKLTVVEWIVFSYIMCVDGFSGFSEDDKYTCHNTVRKLQFNKYTKSEEDRLYISDYEIEKIPQSVYDKKGNLKEYIDPWEYLTRVYLYDDPQGKPLGLPLYENPIYDGCILGGRGVAKSYCIFSGDFLHEWTFGGVKKMSDIDNVNAPKIFTAGSPVINPLLKSLKHAIDFFNGAPGGYVFSEEGRPKYGGPFYRDTKGTIGTGGVIVNEVKNKNGSIRLAGPSLYINTLTPENTKIGAGDRTYRQYVEEFGFLSFAKDVYNKNKDSLRLGDDKTGTSLSLGTAGDMGSIEEPKEIFENPEGFEIFGIPNYWKNTAKKIGLFLPCLLAYRKYFDEHGNADIERLLNHELKKREDKKNIKDSDTVNSDITFNPITPEEMLIPSGFSILPKMEAQNQIADIDSYDWDKKILTYGDLVPQVDGKIKFERDTRGENRVLNTMSYDVNGNLDSVFVFAEHPIDNTPEDLYYIIYDPVRNTGTGTSLNGLIVYKGILTGNPTNFEDNIVCSKFWRNNNLKDSYEEVLKAARYYNAKIFPERTVPGFNDYCTTNGYTKYLVPEPKNILKSLGFTYKNYVHGFDMNNAKLKYWALDKLSEWLKSCDSKDKDENGFCKKRKINYIFFKNILEEIKNHNTKDNFDAISVLLGLVILREELREKIKVNPTGDKEEKITRNPYSRVKMHRVKKARFIK